VLLSKNCGRAQKSGLLSAHDCFEDCSDCDFCFTETNVTANKSVHWSFRFHVSFCLVDSQDLIGGFSISKTVFKFDLPFGVRGMLLKVTRIPLTPNGRSNLKTVLLIEKPPIRSWLSTKQKETWNRKDQWTDLFAVTLVSVKQKSQSEQSSKQS
jgi:hypothetical protein